MFKRTQTNDFVPLINRNSSFTSNLDTAQNDPQFISIVDDSIKNFFNKRKKERLETEEAEEEGGELIKR